MSQLSIRHCEIKNIKSGKKDLRNFGITIGLILFLISGILFYFDNKLFLNFFYVSIFFISLYIFNPVRIRVSSQNHYLKISDLIYLIKNYLELKNPFQSS